MSQHPVAQSRRQLFDYLDGQMNADYRSILKTGRLENETTQVKTYLLEFDWHESIGEEIDNEAGYIASALTIGGTKKRNELVPSVINTDEDGFYYIEWPRGNQKIRMYLDTSSDASRRFWIGYSLAPSMELDKILDILSGSPESRLDRVWLWPELLRQIQSWGEFRGVGLDYDHRFFESSSAENLDSTSYLKLQLWGGPETQNVLAAITEARKGRVNLSKVRMKYSEEDDRRRFVLEEIKFNGKFTCRGTSFASHQILITRLRAAYAEKVKEMETKHTICCSFNKGESLVVSGDPISFFPGEPIANVKTFCAVVFGGTSPFHLWGLVQQISGDHAEVNAIDLHTGSRLFFEVYSDEIRMYMYPGSCGNTVVRFFTNLQRTLNASVSAKNTKGQEVF